MTVKYVRILIPATVKLTAVGKSVSFMKNQIPASTEPVQNGNGMIEVVHGLQYLGVYENSLIYFKSCDYSIIRNFQIVTN